jgi:hypothetical protein
MKHPPACHSEASHPITSEDLAATNDDGVVGSNVYCGVRGQFVLRMSSLNYVID